MPIVASDSLNHVPDSVRQAVSLVIEYLWDEELKHFLAHADEDTKAESGEHVFVALCELRTYFEGRKHAPRCYLAKVADQI